MRKLTDLVEQKFDWDVERSFTTPVKGITNVKYIN